MKARPESESVSREWGLAEEGVVKESFTRFGASGYTAVHSTIAMVTVIRMDVSRTESTASRRERVELSERMMRRSGKVVVKAEVSSTACLVSSRVSCLTMRRNRLMIVAGRIYRVLLTYRSRDEDGGSGVD